MASAFLRMDFLLGSAAHHPLDLLHRSADVGRAVHFAGRVHLLRAFRGKARRVHIHFHALAPDEIERAVLENRVNLGIGVFHQHRPGLLYGTLYDDPVELYCGADHALFDRPPHGLNRNDLHAVDLAHRAYRSERQVAPLTADLHSTESARQIEGVAFLILSGWHIGYLPVAYAQRWVTSGRMRSILPATYRLNTKIELVTRRGADACKPDLRGYPAGDYPGIARLSAGRGRPMHERSKELERRSSRTTQAHSD